MSPARKKQKKAPSLDQDDNNDEAEGYKEEKSFSSPTRKKRKKVPLLDPCAAERDTNVTGGFTGTSITTKKKKGFAAQIKRERTFGMSLAERKKMMRQDYVPSNNAPALTIPEPPMVPNSLPEPVMSEPPMVPTPVGDRLDENVVDLTESPPHNNAERVELDLDTSREGNHSSSVARLPTLTIPIPEVSDEAFRLANIIFNQSYRNGGVSGVHPDKAYAIARDMKTVRRNMPLLHANNITHSQYEEALETVQQIATLHYQGLLLGEVQPVAGNHPPTTQASRPANVSHQIFARDAPGAQSGVPPAGTCEWQEAEVQGLDNADSGGDKKKAAKASPLAGQVSTVSELPRGSASRGEPLLLDTNNAATNQIQGQIAPGFVLPQGIDRVAFEEAVVRYHQQCRFDKWRETGVGQRPNEPPRLRRLIMKFPHDPRKSDAVCLSEERQKKIASLERKMTILARAEVQRQVKQHEEEEQRKTQMKYDEEKKRKERQSQSALATNESPMRRGLQIGQFIARCRTPPPAQRWLSPVNLSPPTSTGISDSPPTTPMDELDEVLDICPSQFSPMQGILLPVHTDNTQLVEHLGTPEPATETEYEGTGDNIGSSKNSPIACEKSSSDTD